MTSMRIISAVGICLLHILHTGLSLRIESKSQMFTQEIGSTVKLPCTIQGPEFNGFKHVVVWYKLSGGSRHQINTVSMINPPFSETKRYTVDPSQGEEDGKPVVLYPLSLKDITLSENGNYECELKHGGDLLASVNHEIVVPAPLEKFTFVSNHTKFSNKTGTTSFEFVELTPGYVRCHAVGGNPTPSLRLFRGNVEVTGEFDKKVEAIAIGVAGLQTIRHEVTLESSTYRVTRDQRGDDLKCVAKFHRFTQLRQVKMATLEVKYAPGFLCAHEVTAPPMAREFTLECRIYANPPVEPSSVTWYQDNVDFSMSLRDETKPGYNATYHIDPENRSLRVSLHLSNLTSESFTIYRIRARNTIGRKEITISMVKGAPTTTFPPSTETPTTTTSPDLYRNDAVISGKQGRPATFESSAMSSRISYSNAYCWIGVIVLYTKLVLFC